MSGTAAMNLGMVFEHSPQQIQEHRLTPLMLMYLDLLQMPLHDLKEEIEENLRTNPATEDAREIEGGSSEPLGCAKGDPAEVEAWLKEVTLIEEQIAQGAKTRRPGGSSDGDDPRDPMIIAPAKPAGLKDHLRNQLLFVTGIGREVRRCLEYLIESLDDGGYLPHGLGEIARSGRNELGNQEPASLQGNLESAVVILQHLDPRGVGARSPQECLLLQLDGHDPLYAAKGRLIRRHLEDMAGDRMTKIVKDFLEDRDALAELGFKPPVDPKVLLEDLKLAIAEIGALHREPGADFTGERAPRVFPDAVIRQVDDRYEVVIKSSYLPPVMVSRSCEAMLADKSLSPRDREYISGKVRAARNLVSAIELRRFTLQRIVTEIIRRQTAFLDHGLDHLKPLRMRDVGDELGIHESTVSRATNGKWMETPRGILPMMYFFARPAPGEDGATRPALLERIREIIGEEDRRKPLSDKQIEKTLEREGVSINRRTITKYRKKLGIPSTPRRRQH